MSLKKKFLELKEQLSEHNNAYYFPQNTDLVTRIGKNNH